MKIPTKALTAKQIENHKLSKKIHLPETIYTDKTDYKTLTDARVPIETDSTTGTVTLGRLGVVRKTNTSVEIDLLLYTGGNVGMKIGLMKWQLYLSQPNLSNPRLINIHPLFKEWQLGVVNYQLNNFNLWLQSKTKAVNEIPTELIAPVVTLKFDRINGASYGYGSTAECYITLQDEIVPPTYASLPQPQVMFI